ncbi:chaplin family protein [Streptomyces sp. NPDC051452]|uniref:chaplin n=1 Tax=Streptomyces sp. NPDC051452 TaxID=3365654 RepID=UPI0037BA5E19
MIAIAAASGAMAMAGPAHADSTADGAAVGSPGLISGNTVQLPVHVPVNACGNTVNVVGLLNPAMGNTCANVGGGGTAKDHGPAKGGATAASSTHNSPGVVSGNGVQLPVDLPVNVSGNSVDVVGIGNPVFGNTSVNTSTPRHEEPQPEPPTRVTPPKHTEPPAPPQPVREHPAPKPTPVVERHPTVGTLAHTGTDDTWTAVAASMASLLGGTVLYRRFRARTLHREG